MSRRSFDDDWKATTAVILALILLIIWLWLRRNGGGCAAYDFREKLSKIAVL